MVNMTLSIPPELHKKMKNLPEIKWSEVARQAIERRVLDLEIINEIASKSKLTQKDAERIARKVREGISKRHNLK